MTEVHEGSDKSVSKAEHTAEKDVEAETFTRCDMEQAWMDGAFYYGGDQAEQWYFNDGGDECNPHRALRPAESCHCGHTESALVQCPIHRDLPAPTRDGAT